MSRNRKFSWSRWIFVLLLLGVLGAGIAWLRKEPKDAAPDYKTAAIARGEITQAVTANGQLSPVKNVAVGSQISGIVKEVKADFNSRVSEGEVIAQIDPSTFEQNVEQAEAELANTKAALELAQMNNKRAQELRKDDLLAPAEADKTLAEFHQAQAAVRIREAALSKAKLDLSRTTIYAPIDGIVISRNVDVGQTVAASFNTPTLFQIANDLAKMQIDAMVSEADVGGIEEKQKVEFTVDAFPGRPFQGSVKQVRFVPTTNQNVVTYATIIEVNNADLKLRPGMTANTSIITAQRKETLKIPNAALRFRPTETAPAKAGTNAPAARSVSTNSMATNASSDSATSGDGRREEMRKRFESMTPEQREEFRARRAAGGGGSGGEGAKRAEPSTRTVYTLSSTNSASGIKETPQPVVIKTGISDGSFTEVLEGLNEGDVVITGLNLPATAAASAARPGSSSPFGSPFGGRGPR